MEINSLNNLNTLSLAKNDLTNTQAVQGKSFDDILKNAINDVNKTQVEGYDAMRGIATGDVPNLQEAVAKITKAESTLKLALEVKNKALGSYKEIMRMQI